MTAPSDVALRLESLQHVSVELAGALTPAGVADVIVERAATAFGGLSGSLCLLLDDGETLELVRQEGYHAVIDERWHRFSLSDSLPAGDAIRARAPVLLGSVAERDRRYPVFSGVPTTSQSFAVLPLFVGDVPVGVFTIGFPEERTFDPDDLGFLGSLAALCAQSLHRARLHEAAEQAADRLAFLAEASAVLGSSLDYEATLGQVARLAVPRLADLCAVVVGALHEGPRLVAVEHADPAVAARCRELLGARIGSAGDVGVAGVLRTGKPQWAPVVTDALLARATPAQRELAAVLGVGSAAIVPLVARGRTLGAMTLGTRVGRAMNDDDFALAQDLAGRAAAAVDNARLFAAQARVARTLQESLLPPALPQIPGLELAARYLPAVADSDVGGDFYDVAQVAHGRWVLAIGDVCGKGVGAARHTALVRHAVRSAAVTHASPADILRHVNDVLLAAGPGGDGDQDETLCTACVVAVELDARGARAVVAAAGHPLPVLVRPGAPAVTAGAPGCLLGAFGDIEIDERGVILQPGSALVLYTDGITEGHRQDRFFGEDGLLAALPTESASAEEMADAVVACALEFVAGRPTDDMAVLVVRSSPAPPTPTLSGT